MPYIVEKAEEKLLDAIGNSETWVQRDPGMIQDFAELARMRNTHQEAGTTLKTPDWKLVAKIKAPLLNVAEVLNPVWLNGNGKKDFYAWLGRNPQFCAYDRRTGRRR